MPDYTMPRVCDETDQGIGLDGFCGRCHRHRYFSPAEAEALFGRETIIRDAEKRLRCTVCGTTGRGRPAVTLRMAISDFYATGVNGVPGGYR